MSRLPPTSKIKAQQGDNILHINSSGQPLNTLIPPRSLSPPIKPRAKNYIQSNSKSVVIFKRNLESTGRYSPFNPPKDLNDHAVIPLRFHPPTVGVCFIIILLLF